MDGWADGQMDGKTENSRDLVVKAIKKLQEINNNNSR